MAWEAGKEEETGKWGDLWLGVGLGWAGGRVVWGKGRTCRSGDASRGGALLLMGRACIGNAARQRCWRGGLAPHCIAALVLISGQALVFGLLTGKGVDSALFYDGESRNKKYQTAL